MSEWAVRRPHPALRSLVGRYIGYTQTGVTLGVHRGLPSRHVTLIISLADPIRFVGMPGSDQSPVTLAGLVGGLHLGPALIAQDRFQSGIHVELEPLGAHALFGMPASELSGVITGLGDVGAPGLGVLPERLALAESWRRRFDILDETFRAALTETGPSPEVRFAWRRLVGSGGGTRVSALAEETGWSRRHLTERFRREVGVTPKQAARLLRFERAGARLRCGDKDLARLAAECGYYDQAHFSNEWRALAGCSPRTWLAEELPFLQDAEGEVRTDSLA